MLRYVISWKTMVLVILGCLVLTAIQFAVAEGMMNREVVWSGDCVPVGVSAGMNLKVRCYDDGPEITDSDVTRGFIVAALAGQRVDSVSCVVRRTPFFGSLHMTCEPPSLTVEE